MPTGIHVHKLDNIDLDNLVADCANCGSNSPIKLKSGKPRCRGSIRDARNKSKSGGGAARHGIPRNDATMLKLGAECYICGSDKSLVIDHSHETGDLRGILCSSHNIGIGLFKDNIDHLLAAIMYLDNPPGVEWQR